MLLATLSCPASRVLVATWGSSARGGGTEASRRSASASPPSLLAICCSTPGVASLSVVVEASHQVIPGQASPIRLLPEERCFVGSLSGGSFRNLVFFLGPGSCSGGTGYLRGPRGVQRGAPPTLTCQETQHRHAAVFYVTILVHSQSGCPLVP
jgi:hypothetical protein